MFRKLSHVLLDAASTLGRTVATGTRICAERLTVVISEFVHPRPNALVPIRVRANRIRRG